MLAMYAWGKSYLQSPLAADAGRRDRILRGIQGAQVASLGVYQGLENAAYLASKGVLTSAGWQGEKGKARENRAWLWSCRLWAAYVVLEGVRLGVEWRYSDRDGEKGDKVARETANRLWWRDLVSNAAYFPMTLHWSVDGGVLSDVGVGLCGIFAGGANLVEAWRATA